MNIFIMLAIIFLCVAHIIRLYRWQLFINIYEKPQLSNLIKALTMGYFANYFLPFKLGDLIRAIIAGKRMKNGFSLSFSSVIIDRYLDVIVVGIILTFIYLLKVNLRLYIQDVVVFYVLFSTILLILPVLFIVSKKQLKKISCNIARIFNQDLELHILQFFWALIWNFKDIVFKIDKIKLTLATMSMWTFYLVSYYCFAKSLVCKGIECSAFNIFLNLFSINSLKNSEILSLKLPVMSVDFIVYMSIPLIIMFMVSFLFKTKYFENNEMEECLNLLPHVDTQERLNFLEEYFTNNKNRDYIKNYLKINQSISIVKDFSAGSNATTMLCMNNDSMFYRKYAFNKDAEKLYEQIKWIDNNKHNIALPAILKHAHNSMYCYYDMEFLPNAISFFEYIHSMPFYASWDIINNIFNNLNCTLYKNCVGSDINLIDKYIEEKITNNINKIKQAKTIHLLLKYKTLIINGVEYDNLQSYCKYLTKDYLKAVFKNDTISSIHGDLTVENIICLRENLSDNYYLIDPNTGNIHNSPNLDYAKLLQSIHGGYEFLMRLTNVKIYQNKINFLYTKSSRYIELHQSLLNYMLENFGKERTKSIYFHEIVHWLRLLPYKINKNENLAVAFYAEMLIVMNDIIKMCESGIL